MKEILLEDILHLGNLEGRIKVRFNQESNYENPIEVYKSNPDDVNTRWLFWRENKRYFDVDDIAVCLLKISNDEWLLTTIKRITKELNVKNGINYEGQELEEFKQYFGRVIVTYHKSHRVQHCYYETSKNKLIVNQILPDIYRGENI